MRKDRGPPEPALYPPDPSISRSFPAGQGCALPAGCVAARLCKARTTAAYYFAAAVRYFRADVRKATEKLLHAPLVRPLSDTGRTLTMGPLLFAENEVCLKK
jgi:hypothetical protein